MQARSSAVELRAYTSAVAGSIPAGPTKSMLYVSAFLYLLAIILGIKAFKHDSKEEKGLAFAFFAAALGTTLISVFAITTIQSV